MNLRIDYLNNSRGILSEHGRLRWLLASGKALVCCLVCRRASSVNLQVEASVLNITLTIWFSRKSEVHQSRYWQTLRISRIIQTTSDGRVPEEHLRVGQGLFLQGLLWKNHGWDSPGRARHDYCRRHGKLSGKWNLVCAKVQCFFEDSSCDVTQKIEIAPCIARARWDSLHKKLVSFVLTFSVFGISYENSSNLLNLFFLDFETVFIFRRHGMSRQTPRTADTRFIHQVQIGEEQSWWRSWT